jgi:uncharacterized oxidoreductase
MAERHYPGSALGRSIHSAGWTWLTGHIGHYDVHCDASPHAGISSRVGPELGFTREPAGAVAAAVIEGMEQNAFEVIRGGEALQDDRAEPRGSRGP